MKQVSTGKQVAIKKVANAFEDMVDAKRMPVSYTHLTLPTIYPV